MIASARRATSAPSEAEHTRQRGMCVGTSPQAATISSPTRQACIRSLVRLLARQAVTDILIAEAGESSRRGLMGPSYD